MGTFYPGPKVTYVTDPDLSLMEQQHVLTAFMRAADGFRIRIAFRLPDASDDEISALVKWYWSREASEPYLARLEEPLYHYRKDFVDRYPENACWASVKHLRSGIRADAYSVHNRGEVQSAIDAGASEIIFGHVFATDSHPGQHGRGISGLSEAQATAKATAGLIVTAIGGIHEGTIDEIGRVGVHSVACMRAISRSPDIIATLWTLHQNWNTGYTQFLKKGNEHDR